KDTRARVLALRKGATIGAQPLLLLALQLGLGEAVLAHSCRLGQDGTDPREDAVFANSGRGPVILGGSYERPLEHGCIQEGSIGSTLDLIESSIDQVIEKPTNQLLSVVTNGVHLLGRAFVVYADRRIGILRIRNDLVERLLMPRHLEGRSVEGRIRFRQRLEVFTNQGFEPVGVEISDRHDGHQIGPVPALIKGADRGGRRIAYDLRLADRKAISVP